MNKDIGKLIAEGKMEEAKIALQELVSVDLTDVERGRALVTLALLYIKIKNSINQEFLAEMKKTIAFIRSASASEIKVGDAIALAKVRSALQS